MMVGMSDDLVMFLLARVGEDEAVTREALDGREWADSDWPPEVYDDGARNVAVAFSPARVLAECAAKRHLLDEARVWGDGCVAVMARYMAEPYANHPDYREEWRA